MLLCGIIPVIPPVIGALWNIDPMAFPVISEGFMPVCVRDRESPKADPKTKGERETTHK